jgi:hypothetical protein
MTLTPGEKIEPNRVREENARSGMEKKAARVAVREIAEVQLAALCKESCQETRHKGDSTLLGGKGRTSVS